LVAFDRLREGKDVVSGDIRVAAMVNRIASTDLTRGAAQLDIAKVPAGQVDPINRTGVPERVQRASTRELAGAALFSAPNARGREAIEREYSARILERAQGLRDPREFPSSTREADNRGVELLREQTAQREQDRSR
jgi:hypothetical protein